MSSRSSLDVTAASISMRGQRRRRNEDCLFIDAGCRYFIVADGMGGRPAGDVASQFSVQSIATEVASIPNLASKRQALTVMNRAFEVANSRLRKFGSEHGCGGMGAAVLLAVRSGSRIYISGLGDCRAYLLRGQHLKRLTTDDTLVAHLFSAETTDVEQVYPPGFRSPLVRYIGCEPFQPSDEAIAVKLRRGDRFVLCSDGLFNALTHAEIQSMLAGSRSARDAAIRLKRFAKAAKARDDASCIVLFVDRGTSHDAELNESKVLRETVASI